MRIEQLGIGARRVGAYLATLSCLSWAGPVWLWVAWGLSWTSLALACYEG